MVCLKCAVSPIEEQTALVNLHSDPIYSTGSHAQETTSSIEIALNLIEERMMVLGDGSRGFWLVFAASCFTDALKDPEKNAAWREKIINRIISICSTISNCQIESRHSSDNGHAMFARYMRHIKRTATYAKIDVTGSDEATVLDVQENDNNQVSFVLLRLNNSLLMSVLSFRFLQFMTLILQWSFLIRMDG